MADKPSALTTIPSEMPTEADYDALCAALMETARGRWFLREHARRNRHADIDRLIEAIARIETVIRGDRAELADQSVRINLLEMVRSIALTRAEAAEIKPYAEENGKPVGGPIKGARDIAAAAERLLDVSWIMRERGIEPASCDQIDEIARTVQAASALRDPSDRRAHRLSEALGDLERRISAMLDASAGERAAELAREVRAEQQEEQSDACSEAEHDARETWQRNLPTASASVTTVAAEAKAYPVAISSEKNQQPTVVAPGCPTEGFPTAGPAEAANSATVEPAPADFPLGPSSDQVDRGAPAPTKAAEAIGGAAQRGNSLPVIDLVAHTAAPTSEPARSGPAAPPAIPRSTPRPAESDPLAALKAMSEEERLALFT